MGRLIVLLFLLPWWAYIPASIGVLWLGERVYEQALATEAEKRTALEQGMPEAVDLGAFDRTRDTHMADEVHVSGWFDPDLNYELVKRKNGVPTDTRYLFMMFGKSDPKGASEVRAALMLTKKQRELFLEQVDDYLIGVNDSGEFLYGFNGFADTSVTLGDMASDAFEEQGLSTSADFIYIEPFFQGREAALAPRGVPDKTRRIGWAIAAVVALIGVAKRVMSVRARPTAEEAERAALAESEAPAAAAPAVAPGFSVPQGVAEDSPLGRLARRNAPPAAPPPDDPYEAEPAYSPQSATDRLEGEPRSALVFDSGASVAETADDRFPPVPEYAPAQAAQKSSDASFYAKLVLAMLVVGGIAYNPSVLSTALPFAAVALFSLGVYLVFRKIRSGGAALSRSPGSGARRRRRPDGAAQPVSAGVGGHRIDLTAPVRGSGREHGVI